MKTLALALAVLIGLGLIAGAQAQVGEPDNFAAAGFAYNGTQGNGWASYGTRIAAGTYSFTTYDVTVASRKPLTFQYSLRTGVAYDVTKFVPALSFGGRVHLLGIGDGGGVRTQNALGSAFSGGGFGTYDFGAKFQHLTGIAGARVLRTSTGGTGVVVEAGIGIGW